MAEEPELEEYEEVEEEQPVGDIDAGANRGYVGIHSVSFDDMQLKRELLRAIQDSGFEHPSESTGAYMPSINFSELVAKWSRRVAVLDRFDLCVSCSSAAMHSHRFARSRRNGAGQVRDGEDCSFRAWCTASARTPSGQDLRARDRAYARACTAGKCL
jgi:hypothetical protein